MILGNDDPYEGKFKDEEKHNHKEMEKSQNLLKTKMRLSTMMIMEVDINEFSMGSITS